MKNNYEKFIILIGLGVITLYLAININTDLLYVEHEFSLTTNPRDNVINDFQIYFDFGKEIGNMSFSFDNNKYIESIVVRLPNFETNLTNVTIRSSQSSSDKENIIKYAKVDPDIVGDEYVIVIDSLKEKLNKSYVEVLFSSKMQPNGKFFINSFVDIIYSEINRVKFKLGSKYECKPVCFNNLINSGFRYYSDQTDVLLITLEKNEIGQYKYDTTYNMFDLNVLNKNLKIIKEALFALSISLIAFSIEFLMRMINEQTN